MSTGAMQSTVGAYLQELLTGTASGGGSLVGSAGSTNEPITNNVTINGDVNGYNDIDQLSQDLATSQISTLESRQHATTRVTAL